MPFPWKKLGQGSGETRWSTEAKKEQPQVVTGLLPAGLGFRGGQGRQHGVGRPQHTCRSEAAEKNAVPKGKQGSTWS